jgi:opacity protein-like surface antigen
MSWRNILLRGLASVLFLSPFLIAPAARAQHEIEITPFGGTKFGGNITLPQGSSNSVDYLPITNSVDYGVEGDYSIWPNFQAEFQWDHQPTDVNEHLIATNNQTFLTSADIDMFQWDVAYNFKSPDAKLKPFVDVGLGFTHWRPSSVLPLTNTFSYNLGGGVKYFFSTHVGLRVDIRWSPSRTTTQDETYIDPFFGPETVPVSSHAQQGQANVGLIFRFR